MEKAKALDRALHFQRIALNYVVNPVLGLVSPVSIQLNTVAKHLSTIGDNLERHRQHKDQAPTTEHLETRETCESAGLRTRAAGRSRVDFCRRSARVDSFLRQTRMCDWIHNFAVRAKLWGSGLHLLAFLHTQH